MNWKWLVVLGAINFGAVLQGIASLMVDFAILAPERLKFEVANTESVKRAIFQAESGGIEAMRSSAFVGAGTLAAVMILNFALICLTCRRRPIRG